MFSQRLLSVTLLSVFGIGPSLAVFSTASVKNISAINWVSCIQNATLPVTCGTLAVPLDYTNPCANETINIQLIKFNATKQPVKGSILFNPGGPGDSSREFLALYVQEMMIATSGHYDLIAPETRGVGDTLPFACFTAIDEAILASGLPASTNASDSSLGLTWAYATLLAESCFEANKDIGSFMSTAFIARDMMQIVDALGEDGLLRFYGFSYGTVLGATLAAMFPERIDKMVLDGVVNVPQWIYGSNEDEVLQSDDAVRAYFKSCLENPTSCAIHRNKNTTAAELFGEVVDLIEDLKFNPIVLGDNVTTSIVQGEDVKSLLFSIVKTGMSPSSAGLSIYLNAIMEGNATVYLEVSELLNAAATPIYPNYGTEAVYGIECPDTQIRTNKLQSLDPIIETNYAESYFGGAAPISLLLPCAQWKMKSKETFTGPFVAKTKNPLLMISSPFDPNTPLVSARNMSQGFDGSVVLQQNYIGHTSIAQPSTCTIKATSAYFLNGTLPLNGTVCEPDFNLLSNITVAAIYKLAAN